jgi:hypothetical protein
MGTKVYLILRSVQYQAHWYNILSDEASDRRLRIRHGIQRNAACSVLATKIRKYETLSATRSF